MANYPMKAVEHDGLLAPPAPVRLGADGAVSVESIVSLNQILASLVKHINSGLSVGTSQAGSRAGNFRNQWLVFTTPATPDQEFELPHGLGRTPIGYTTWFIDKAGVVYVSNYGSWNRERLLLKCSVASASCAIELA